MHHDVEHRQRENDEQNRDAEVEPGRRVDRAERARGENHGKAEEAVHERHCRAIRGAEQESATARAGLNAGADDGEIDRNHRQHAGRQVQRQPADQDEQEDRQRSASFEHPFLFDAVLGVVNEGEKVGRVEIAERGSLQRETVQGSHLVGRHRGSADGGRQNGHRGRRRPPVSAAHHCPRQSC